MPARKKKHLIVAIVLLACLCMGLVDALWQPAYFIKSLVKIGLFLLLPALYGLYDRSFRVKSLFTPDKRGFGLALLLGGAVYAVVLGAYFLFRGIFDFSAVASSVTDAVGVSRDNFIPVAIERFDNCHNTLVNVKITNQKNGKLFGERVSTPKERI